MTGPFSPTGPGETPSRRAIFTCRPAIGRRRSGVRAEDSPAAGAPRVPRRHERRATCRCCSTSSRAAASRPARSTAGSTWRCAASSPARSSCCASSPIRRASPPGAAYRLVDLALASRLSFFLWSSIPDDELLDAAAQGELKKPAVLDRQVRRMLADPKAQALIENFAGQWLHLRNLRNKQPNSFQFPDFDDDLRRAMIARGRAVLRQHRQRGPQRPRSDDRRLHLRQRAACAALRHPGDLRQPVPPRHADRRRAARPAGQGRHPDGDVARAPHVAGAARQVGAREHHRRVAARRRPTTCRRSSDEQKPEKPRSGREALEQHRASPTCAACHRVMDPDRVRARELRRRRRVARQGRRDARRLDRRVGTAGRRHAGRRRRRAAATRWCATRRRSCAR